MKKKFWIFTSIILLLAIVFILHNVFNNMTSKEKIFTLVEQNVSEIKKDIKNNDFTFSKNLKGIKDINIQNNGIIDFYCGGAGFGSSTSYCGFYWSENDSISDIWCEGAKDEIKTDGSGFSYHEVNGDNYYYTEKICDHFYYYTASF